MGEESNKIAELELASNTVVKYEVELKAYETHLIMEEKSQNTISKYMRDIRKFMMELKGLDLNKEIMLKWKQEINVKYSPASVNSMIASLNSFLIWLGKSELKVKPLKIQREIFEREERELSIEEYYRLIRVAEGEGDTRLSLLIQTICSTGIRVSELQYVTIEGIRKGRETVQCKGKSRIIFYPSKLISVILKYCKRKNICRGSIFVTKNGRVIDRSNIWRMMKRLCEKAKVETTKVFPHNFRHLFAKMYYGIEKDIVKLADLLGHSNISTTRIYTMESGVKHIEQIERLNLVYTT